jgi:hypothetical protein
VAIEASTERSEVSALGLVGLTSTATRAAEGTSSRVVAHGEQDRDHCCRLGSGEGRKRGRRDDYCDPSANQIGRQLGQPVVLILGPAVRDGDILALNIADFFRALAECAQWSVCDSGDAGVEESNHRRHRLLRPRRERPRGRAAEQRDELSPSLDHLVGAAEQRRR